MLRDNLAGLIEPMIDCAGAHAFGGHPKQEPTGGCSRSTELTICRSEAILAPRFSLENGTTGRKRQTTRF